jgi:lipopolysaccharide/colanic/teichoic acid biosynthesis glycosyltransferase
MVLPWRNPRRLLWICAGLDCASVLLALGLINLGVEPDLWHPPNLVLAVAILYCLFSWLLGSYTLLRWPWLQLRLVMQRLLFVAMATMFSIVLGSWALGVGSDQVSLLNRSELLEWLTLQSVFALTSRLLLRWKSRATARPIWQLLAAPEHQKHVLREWQRNPFVRPPRLLTPTTFEPDLSFQSFKGRQIRLALAPDLDHQLSVTDAVEQLRSKGVMVTTLEELAQRQLERLPPTLLPSQWLQINDLPWINEFSLQRKIKRTADVIVSLLLLALSLAALAAAIWLEDRGPILYVQTRTGWCGQCFRLYKLRTMRFASCSAPTPWTTKADARVTSVGGWLRRTRLDELPQLINVLRGEMSLIGPRPEQPHLDEQLAQDIPHYSKRYWMLPGLSGWAQVCGPAYPATIEESELKLSYDLYYIRNWSLQLDLLIFAKTFKTLLQFRGI